MARIRQAKPEFLRHEKLQELQVSHAGLNPMLVFLGLWQAADNAGRFEWRPRQLKLDILPFVPFDMAETLELLKTHGFISRYTVEGESYGLVVKFSEHQRLSGKEAKMPAKYPSPQQGSTREAPVKQEGNQGLRVKDEGLRIKDKGLSIPREPFDGEMWMRAIFNAHPRPEWGQRAQVAWLNALHAEMAENGWNEIQAAEFLLARSQLYAECVKAWPKSEISKCNGAYSFFESRIYKQDDALWRRSNGDRKAQTQQDQQRDELRELCGMAGAPDGPSNLEAAVPKHRLLAHQGGKALGTDGLDPAGSADREGEIH
jgi:hypothetical protein